MYFFDLQFATLTQNTIFCQQSAVSNLYNYCTLSYLFWFWTYVYIYIFKNWNFKNTHLQQKLCHIRTLLHFNLKSAKSHTLTHTKSAVPERMWHLLTLYLNYIVKKRNSWRGFFITAGMFREFFLTCTTPLRKTSPNKLKWWLGTVEEFKLALLELKKLRPCTSDGTIIPFFYLKVTSLLRYVFLYSQCAVRAHYAGSCINLSNSVFMHTVSQDIPMSACL